MGDYRANNTNKRTNLGCMERTIFVSILILVILVKSTTKNVNVVDSSSEYVTVVRKDNEKQEDGGSSLSSLWTSNKNMIKSANPTDDSSMSTTTSTTTASICSLFSSSLNQPNQYNHPTASHVWSRHLDWIYNASQHADMPDYNDIESNKKMKSLLYDELIPLRLRRGIRSMPATRTATTTTSIKDHANNNDNSDKNSVAHIMKIVHKRIEYLQQTKENNDNNKNQDEARPLQIVVLGGSVTAGRACWPRVRALVNKNCAWPRRLEFLINQLLSKAIGNDNRDSSIIQVHNIAMGGISTIQGITFVKYWMYPADKNHPLQRWGPDIIMHSFSTNDSFPPWGQTTDLIRGVYKNARTALEEFVRVSLRIRSPLPVSTSTAETDCSSQQPQQPPPLVVFVDDYLGHQQDQVLGELSYNTAMVQIANWYQDYTMAISYADVVRDVVYQNTQETTFSAPWYPVDRRTHKLKVQVHFGHYGHMSIAWAVAFGMLELATQYCDDTTTEPRVSLSESHDHSNETMTASVTDTSISRSSSYSNPLILPPRLTEELTMQNISQEWLNPTIPTDHVTNGGTNLNNVRTAATTTNTTTIDCSKVIQERPNANANPCSMAWVSGPVGLNANALSGVMKEYVIHNDGWKVETNANDGWKQKIGWVATKLHSTFTMELPNLSKDVRVVSVMYMKSYGDTWKDSRAKFTVQESPSTNNNVTTTTTRELDGYHISHVSISFTEEIQLVQPVLQNSNIQLQVELIGGTTFKILGLMFCAW